MNFDDLFDAPMVSVDDIPWRPRVIDADAGRELIPILLAQVHAANLAIERLEDQYRHLRIQRSL